MRSKIQTVACCTAILSAVCFFTIASAETTHFNKAQVGDRIRKVENGVDDFEKYLTTRGENAQNKTASAKSSGGEAKRGDRGGREASAETKGAAKEQAKGAKDDLQNAMDDLNRTTNRLRRKFDPTANYIETKVQMEQVMAQTRKIKAGTTSREQKRLEGMRETCCATCVAARQCEARPGRALR